MRLRSDGLATTKVDGETVLLDLDSSLYLTVNRSGTVLLDLLANECDESHLVAALQDAFALDADRAREDVAAFVALLRERSLLVE